MQGAAHSRGPTRRKVLVVHPHSLLREGLCRVLEEGGFEVIWSGGDGTEVSAAAHTCSPDVILLEWEAPGVDVALVECLTDPADSPPVVVMSKPDTADSLSVVLDAGAVGCLSVNLGASEFISALSMLAHGDILISHEMVPAVTSPEGEGGRPVDLLTTRELEILKAMARGATNQEIAEQLFISQHTVKIHVRRILAKMGLRNRQQAAAYAATEGLV